MPSFDVVSEYDAHEANNAIDQANREVSNRFDFKGVEASFEREERKGRPWGAGGTRMYALCWATPTRGWRGPSEEAPVEIEGPAIRRGIS